MSGSVPVVRTVNVTGLPGTTPFNFCGCMVILGGSAACREVETKRIMKVLHFRVKK